MDETATPLSDIKTISRRMVARALHLGENRLQLLLLEVEEERERLLHALILALGAAAFGLLAGVAFTATILVLFWPTHAIAAMSALTVFYLGVAVLLGAKLSKLRRDWEAFSGSLSQLRKDCACLAETLR